MPTAIASAFLMPSIRRCGLGILGYANAPAKLQMADSFRDRSMPLEAQIAVAGRNRKAAGTVGKGRAHKPVAQYQLEPSGRKCDWVGDSHQLAGAKTPQPIP
jgi:hypothetical protein